MEAKIKRFEQLDSIRGLAALSVFASHISIFIPKFIFEDYKNTPFHFFWLGHESVILFFILSGFVLSLPYHSQNTNFPNYTKYLVRRIFRILLPAAVSTFILLILISLLDPLGIQGVSEWGNHIWTQIVDATELFHHFLLLGEINSMKLNPVLWSLVHEFRISIIFPFVLLLMSRLNFMKSVTIAVMIPVFFFIAYVIGLKLFSTDITVFSGGYSSYMLTPHYLAFFILGSVMAKFSNRINEIYKRLKQTQKIIIMAAAFVLYMYNWLVLPNHPVLHMFLLNDWSIATGGSVFILFSLNSERLKSFLLFKPVHFMGKISYSIYLYHIIVMLTILYLFSPTIGVTTSLIISVPISIGVATMMYYMVEVPSVRLGRALTITTKRTIDPMEAKST